MSRSILVGLLNGVDPALVERNAVQAGGATVVELSALGFLAFPADGVQPKAMCRRVRVRRGLWPCLISRDLRSGGLARVRVRALLVLNS